MSEDVHASAERLILQSWIERISEEERAWLDRHLESCARCAGLAEGTEQALRAMRSAAVPMPESLAERTQLRVWLRSRDVGRQGAGRWALWTACGVSWATGLVTAPWVWRTFERAGHWAGAPDLLWIAAVVLWWTIPGLFAAALMLFEKYYPAEPRP
jgi:hypothetical protein